MAQNLEMYFAPRKVLGAKHVSNPVYRSLNLLVTRCRYTEWVGWDGALLTQVHHNFFTSIMISLPLFQNCQNLRFSMGFLSAPSPEGAGCTAKHASNPQ